MSSAYKRRKKIRQRPKSATARDRAIEIHAPATYRAMEAGYEHGCTIDIDDDILLSMGGSL